MKLGFSHVALAAGLAATMWLTATESYARGGFRGGGGGGGFRGGGGGVRAGGMSSISRPSSGFSRSSTPSRPRSTSTARPSGGSIGSGANRGDFRGSADRSNIGNRTVGDRNTSRDRNTVRDRDTNIRNNNNVNIGNDINIDNDGGWGGWDDHVHHPIAAGMAIGATAAVTAAAIGSVYYSVPPGCTWGVYSYYTCDGYYLEPRYEGDTVVYVNVPGPSGATP